MISVLRLIELVLIQFTVTIIAVLKTLIFDNFGTILNLDTVDFNSASKNRISKGRRPKIRKYN